MIETMTRIANIIEEGKLGGPQVRMVRVAAALAGRVETIIFMPRENSGPFRALCEQDSVPYRILPLTRITKEWRVAVRYVLFSPVEVIRLARAFRRERIDLVHVSGGSWQYKGLIAARLAGVPVVWHLNDTSAPGPIRRVFGFFARFADGFICASQRTRDYYSAALTRGKPEFLIPAPVDTERFDPKVPVPGDETLIASWGDAIVVGTVANVNPVKGLETLIRAAGDAQVSRSGLRFVVIGLISARQKKYHRRLIKFAETLGVGQIEFVGARADVRPLLARCDIFVCSSLAESSPMAVWEAMAMTRPVVSTDVGDVARHVRDDESGFIVPVGEHAAMAARIVQLASDAELRQRLGARARAIALESFSTARIGDLTAECYQAILEKAPTAAHNG